MDSGEKAACNRLNWRESACGKVVQTWWVLCAKYEACALPWVWVGVNIVQKLCSQTQGMRSIFTLCPQVLRIQFSFDAGDGRTNVGVKPGLFLDFFNGVDGGRVVFAPEFFGDLGEAEV